MLIFSVAGTHMDISGIICFLVYITGKEDDKKMEEFARVWLLTLCTWVFNET